MISPQELERFNSVISQAQEAFLRDPNYFVDMLKALDKMRPQRVT